MSLKFIAKIFQQNGDVLMSNAISIWTSKFANKDICLNVCKTNFVQK